MKTSKRRVECFRSVFERHGCTARFTACGAGVGALPLDGTSEIRDDAVLLRRTAEDYSLRPARLRTLPPMTTASGRAWDLARRLAVQTTDLDEAQERAVQVHLDPFAPGATHLRPDVSLAGMPPVLRSELVEVHGPARDGMTTAQDREGRLLACYGNRWASVPSMSDDEVEIALEPGLPLTTCWTDLVRPSLQHGLHRHDAVAVHAAAVEHDGGAVLIAGWSETGKTEVALALVESGARFLSDKWSVAGNDGLVSAFPVAVGVRGWALDALPVLRSSLPGSARARLGTSGALKKAIGGPGNGQGAVRIAALARHGLQRAADLGDRVSVRPSRVRAAYGDTSDPARHVPLRAVLVLTTGTTGAVEVEEADAVWAADRLARSAAYERRAFFDLQERGAYSGLTGRDGAREASLSREQQLLSRTFGAAPTVLRVACPFPGDPRRILDALPAMSA